MHHEYAAVEWFLSQKYSTTYGLPLMRLNYAAQLNGDVAIPAASMYMVLKTNIMNKLKLYDVRFV